MARKNLQNFDEIKLRLLQFAEIQRIPKGEFFEKISMFPSNFAGKGACSSLKSDNIVKVLTAFPELNSDWLLLGRGEMLRGFTHSNIAVASAPHAAASNGNLTIAAPAELVSLITSQQETINRLSETVDRLLRVRDSSNVTEG